MVIVDRCAFVKEEMERERAWGGDVGRRDLANDVLVKVFTLLFVPGLNFINAHRFGIHIGPMEPRCLSRHNLSPMKHETTALNKEQQN